MLRRPVFPEMRQGETMALRMVLRAGEPLGQ
jgi:hypothetical protein